MNSLAWKRQIGRWTGAIFTSEKRDVILLYHSVGGGGLSVPEPAFRRQIDWLADNARAVSLSELLGSENDGRLRVVISFDDGYETLHRVVCPILAEYGFPAIVYLNSGLIEEDDNMPSRPEIGHYPGERFLSWRQVQGLVQAGWSAGGHGVEHVDLTMLDESALTEQLVRCKAEIEARLKMPCEHFAYTWGHYNTRTIQAVADAGYLSAATGIHGPVNISSNRYALPRIDIRADYELPDFIDVVTGRWDSLRLKQRLTQILRLAADR